MQESALLNVFDHCNEIHQSFQPSPTKSAIQQVLPPYLVDICFDLECSCICSFA